MITATFAAGEQGKDMPIRLDFDLPDVPAAASLIIDSKVRAVERVLRDSSDALERIPLAQLQLLRDLGLACAELAALLLSAGQHMRPGHQLKSATAALSDAEAVLRVAYDYLEEKAKLNPPMQDPPADLDPSKPHWRITPLPLGEIDWSVIGMPNYATV